MELRKQSTWSWIQPEIFYWRTASGQEVDLVLEDRSGKLARIEVKASATLSASDVRGLQALASTAGKKCCAVLFSTQAQKSFPWRETFMAFQSLTSWPGKGEAAQVCFARGVCSLWRLFSDMRSEKYLSPTPSARRPLVLPIGLSLASQPSS